MPKLVRFDWAIKYLLKHKADFDILEGFLSELLQNSIKIETILESESNKNHANDKFNRIALLVKTEPGQQIIIEMQCSTQWDHFSRMLYGTSKVLCEYLHVEDAYKSVRKIISVNIVFFDLGSGKDYLYKGTTVFKGLHYHDTLSLNPQEQALYQTPVYQQQTPEHVFREYYIIRVAQFHEQVSNKLDEWIYFLKHEKIKESFNAQGIQNASKTLDILQLNHSQRCEYEYFVEDLHDGASASLMINITATTEHAKGHAKGHAEGRAEGRAERDIDIATTMKRNGIQDTEIAKYTGLSLATIAQLTIPKED